jgi:hypothetical protein
MLLCRHRPDVELIHMKRFPAFLASLLLLVAAGNASADDVAG